MRNEITKSMHAAMVELRAAGSSMVEISKLFSIEKFNVLYCLSGKRKTPYRPDNAETIEILKRALLIAERAH